MLSTSKVGIVIPTIYERRVYLFEATESIRTAGNGDILLTGPDGPKIVSRYIELLDQHVAELTGGNLAGKINNALNQLPADCQLIGSMGDDDLLPDNPFREPFLHQKKTMILLSSMGPATTLTLRVKRLDDPKWRFGKKADAFWPNLSSPTWKRLAKKCLRSDWRY